MYIQVYKVVDVCTCIYNIVLTLTCIYMYIQVYKVYNITYLYIHVYTQILATPGRFLSMPNRAQSQMKMLRRTPDDPIASDWSNTA